MARSDVSRVSSGGGDRSPDCRRGARRATAGEYAVTAQVHESGSETTLSAEYVIGADGAHSIVRKSLGVAFSGDAFAEEYMLPTCASAGPPAVDDAAQVNPQAIDTDSAAVTSLAARSPERTAPSTQPHITAELSVPAQWMRPHGSRSACPNSVSTPVPVWPIMPPPEYRSTVQFCSM